MTMLRLVNPALLFSLTWVSCGLGNLIRFIPFFYKSHLFVNSFFTIFYQDCDDSSDEKNCRMVSFDEEKYLKNKPPPSPTGMQKLPITVRLQYPHIRCGILANLLSLITFLIFINSCFSNQFGGFGDPRNQRNPADPPVEV